jgi:C4-dicarboxylate-specific signal transduction histidine kinase
MVQTVEDAQRSRTLQTLGVLTRGALHQIANPLVALVGSAELALRELEPGTKTYDRVALTHRTGTEIAEIVRALQAFVRLQAHGPEEISLGAAANDAIALVAKVLPTHDVELSATGDATVVASPGDVGSELVELLVEALDTADRAIQLDVRAADGGAVVTATGGGERRFPAVA